MILPLVSSDVFAGGGDEDGCDGAVGVGEAVAQAHARAEAAAEVLGHEPVDNGVQATATMVINIFIDTVFLNREVFTILLMGGLVNKDPFSVVS